jgi:outer membrane beta-barrel protein
MRTRALIICLVTAWTAGAGEAEAREWRGRRGVSVVQQRKYPKLGALELTPYTGVIPNDAFVIHVPIGSRLTWHRSERFALELSASATLDVDTALREFLMEQDADVRAQVRDRQRARLDVGIVWSPIYGKLSWLNASVLHIDVYLSAGAGAVYADAGDIGAGSSVRPELYGGLGLRLFLTKTLSLRFEYRQLAYLRADDPSGDSGGVATPSELSIGLGVLLGGAK